MVLRRLLVNLLAAILLTACNVPQSASNGEQASTEAAETVEAVLTREGPDILATGRAEQTALTPITSTPTSTPPSPNPTENETCENSAEFIDDVTIRDNEELRPGESFVKIWRLRNAGGCAWTPAYLLAFFGGHRLEAPQTVSLSREVEPGGVIDLAVEMTAPTQPGTYQGFWKLRSPEGEFFGIGPQGDQSFWVKIVVPAASSTEAPETPTPVAEATETATPSVTPTPTPSPTGPTPTPEPTSTPSPTPTGEATPKSTP